MFETAAVESRVHAVDRRRIAMFPLSLAVHAAAVGTLFLSGIWSVRLPDIAPAQLAVFVGLQKMPVMQAMDPPKPKPVAQQQAAQASSNATPAIQAQQLTTPNAIPDHVGDVDALPDAPAWSTTNNLGVPGAGTGDQTAGTGDPDAPRQAGVGGVTLPVVIRRVQPDYPSFLVKVGLHGSATVECIISRDGSVDSVTVVQATHPLFGESAREAVMKWRFLPGRLNGQAVTTIFRLTVRFEVQR